MGTERIRKEASPAKSSTTSHPTANIADLHRMLGNQGVQRLLQREDKDAPSKDAAEYKEAGEKVAEAIKETEAAKKLIEKAKEEGAAFVATLDGAIISGTMLAFLLTALHANDTPFPISEVPIPLEKLDSSLKDLELKIEYESDGSPLKPEKVMVTFVYTPGAAAAEKAREKKAKEKLEQEIITLRKQNEQFRQMMMTPDERKREQEMLMQALNKSLFPAIPDITHSEETTKAVEKEMPNLLKMR